MDPVQLILIIAGIIVVLVIMSALMAFGRRKGAKRVHDIRQAADRDATAQDPEGHHRDP